MSFQKTFLSQQLKYKAKIIVEPDYSPAVNAKKVKGVKSSFKRSDLKVKKSIILSKSASPNSSKCTRRFC